MIDQLSINSYQNYHGIRRAPVISNEYCAILGITVMIWSFWECQTSDTPSRGVISSYWGSLRVIGGLTRVCLASFTALLVPLEVANDISFGFKHPMMVQLANIHKVELINLVIDLWGPPMCPSKWHCWESRNSRNTSMWGPLCLISLIGGALSDI